MTLHDIALQYITIRLSRYRVDEVDGVDRADRVDRVDGVDGVDGSR